MVVTKDGDELPYDMLVLALGARPDREWHADGVLTFRDGRDGPGYRLLLHQLREGRVNKLAFVKPTGATWPLPLYDLALMTAADCAAHHRPEVELSLITPEEEPLGMFGASASAAVARLLDERGVTLHTSSFGVPRPPGMAGRLARATGGSPSTASSPSRAWSARDCAASRADATGSSTPTRTAGSPAWTASTPPATRRAFPIKQGGLAAQQADAVAEAIAASVGVDIDPQPFRPVLRGVLLTGGRRALSPRRHQRPRRRRLHHLARSPCGGRRTSSPAATSRPTSAARPAKPPTSCPSGEDGIPIEIALDHVTGLAQTRPTQVHPSRTAEYRLERNPS